MSVSGTQKLEDTRYHKNAQNGGTVAANNNTNSETSREQSSSNQPWVTNKNLPHFAFSQIYRLRTVAWQSGENSIFFFTLKHGTIILYAKQNREKNGPASIVENNMLQVLASIQPLVNQCKHATVFNRNERAQYGTNNTGHLCVE
jgi:hypothetical protein